jgi:hypothetical protein
MRIGASVKDHARHGTPRHDISDRIESDEAHRRAARAGRRSGQHRRADDVSRSGRATACSRRGRGDGTRVPSSTGRPFARSSPIQALPERAPDTPQRAESSTDPALRAIARPGPEPGTPRFSAACPADRLWRRLRRNPVRFVSAAGSASRRPHRRDSESECATAADACSGRAARVSKGRWLVLASMALRQRPEADHSRQLPRLRGARLPPDRPKLWALTAAAATALGRRCGRWLGAVLRSLSA